MIGYEVRCLESLEALESVREAWQLLYESNRRLYYFQSYEWNHGLLARTAPQYKIRIWLLYREGKLVLISPMMHLRQGLISQQVFVGHDTHADYLDFVYGELRADDLAVLVRHIIAASPLSVVTFGYMNEEGLAAKLLGTMNLHRQMTSESCFSIQLPATIDEYVASLGKSTRKEINGGVNRLAREHPDCRYEYVSGCRLGRERADEILRTYRERLRDKNLSFRFSEEYAGFLRDYLACSDDSVFAAIYLDDRLAAFNLGFMSRNGEIQVMLVSMDSEYRRLNVGNLLLYKTICHLITVNEVGETKVLAYDLTRGNELYKRKYGGTLSHNLTYSCARFGFVYFGLHLVIRSKNLLRKLGLLWTSHWRKRKVQPG